MRTLTTGLLCSALLLTACAGPLPYRPEDEAGGPSERAVLQALAEVKASDAQRLQVMAAFDAARPKLRAEQAQIGSIGDQLDALSPRTPDYVERVDALASAWTQARAELLRTQAVFEHAVASTLDEGQWNRWQDFMERPRGAIDGRGRRG